MVKMIVNVVLLAAAGCSCGDLLLAGDSASDTPVMTDGRDDVGPDVPVDEPVEDARPDEIETPMLTWAKTYSSNDQDVARVIRRIPDGYAVLGLAIVEDTDFWIQKLDLAGNLIWRRQYI